MNIAEKLESKCVVNERVSENPNEYYENVLDKFTLAFESDDHTPYKKGRALHKIYLEASDSEKALLNQVFINLCGWSINTIFNQALDFEDDVT